MAVLYQYVNYKQDLPYNAFVTGICDCEAHFHEDIELIFIIKGQIEISLDQDSFLLNEMDFILINSNDVHAIQQKQRGKSIQLLIHIKPCLFEMMRIPIKSLHLLCNSAIMEDNFSSSLFTGLRMELFHLIKEIRRLRDDNIYSLAPFILSLISILLKKFPATQKDTVNNKNNIKENPQKIHTIIEYLNDNFTEDITIHDIAAREHISVYHLCHIFKKITGTSIGQYLTEIRISKAKEMLLHQSNKPVTHIAMDCGFKNLSYFYTIFNKKVGCTPLNYRNQTLHAGKKEYMSIQQVNSGLGFYTDINLDDIDTKIPSFPLTLKSHLPCYSSEGKATYTEVKVRIQEKGVAFKHHWKGTVITLDSGQDCYQALQMPWARSDHIAYIWLNFQNNFFGQEHLPFIKLVLQKNRTPMINITPHMDSNSESGLSTFFEKMQKNLHTFIQIFQSSNSMSLTPCCALLDHTVFSMNMYPNEWEFLFKSYAAVARELKEKNERIQIGISLTPYSIYHPPAILKAFFEFCRREVVELNFILLDGQHAPVRFNKQALSLDHYLDALQQLHKILQSCSLDDVRVHYTNGYPFNKSNTILEYTAFMAPFLVHHYLKTLNLTQSINLAHTPRYPSSNAAFLPYNNWQGIIDKQYILKPVDHAFYFLSHLGSTYLDIGENYIITKDDRGDISILLWNYCALNESADTIDLTNIDPSSYYNLFEVKGESVIHVELRGLAGLYQSVEYGFDREFGSVFDYWIRAGSPMIFDHEQFDEIQKIMQLKEYKNPVQYKGTYSKAFTLNPHGIRLIKLIKNSNPSVS